MSPADRLPPKDPAAEGGAGWTLGRLREASAQEAQALEEALIGLRVAALLTYSRRHRRHARPRQIEYRVRAGHRDADIRRWIDAQGVLSAWWGRLFGRS